MVSLNQILRCKGGPAYPSVWFLIVQINLTCLPRGIQEYSCIRNLNKQQLQTRTKQIQYYLPQNYYNLHYQRQFYYCKSQRNPTGSLTQESITRFLKIIPSLLTETDEDQPLPGVIDQHFPLIVLKNLINNLHCNIILLCQSNFIFMAPKNVH